MYEVLEAVVHHLRAMSIPATVAGWLELNAGGIRYVLDVPRSDTDHRPVRILRWTERCPTKVTDVHRDGHWRVRIARAIAADLAARFGWNFIRAGEVAHG
jgi:hypothetical protein